MTKLEQYNICKVRERNDRIRSLGEQPASLKLHPPTISNKRRLNGVIGMHERAIILYATATREEQDNMFEIIVKQCIWCGLVGTKLTCWNARLVIVALIC